MIALLDAVLVNGYGSKAAAGWTKTYTGTNIAVYRASTSGTGATGMYLRVDDTNATYALIKAYKTMSDINTGTDVIPSGTPAYTNVDIYWIKSSTANSTARLWSIIADTRTFYLNVSPNGTTPSTPGNCFIWGAGDYESFVPGNANNYFLAGTYNAVATNSGQQITNAPGTYGTALIGRAQDLSPGKQSRIWVMFIGRDTVVEASGSSTHYNFSTYTGIKFFYPAFLCEDAVQSNITGKLRGAFGMAGRSTTNWVENFGKLPDDPTGPDMIQHLASSANSAALYIRLGDW
jgi:hypothetical protein